jgi:hypothetical protein
MVATICCSAMFFSNFAINMGDMSIPNATVTAVGQYSAGGSTSFFFTLSGVTVAPSGGPIQFYFPVNSDVGKSLASIVMTAYTLNQLLDVTLPSGFDGTKPALQVVQVAAHH